MWCRCACECVCVYVCVSVGSLPHCASRNTCMCVLGFVVKICRYICVHKHKPAMVNTCPMNMRMWLHQQTFDWQCINTFMYYFCVHICTCMHVQIHLWVYKRKHADYAISVYFLYQAKSACLHLYAQHAYARMYMHVYVHMYTCVWIPAAAYLAWACASTFVHTHIFKCMYAIISFIHHKHMHIHMITCQIFINSWNS